MSTVAEHAFDSEPHPGLTISQRIRQKDYYVRARLQELVT